MKKWQIQEVKAKFSDVVREATDHGPQEITHYGETIVVILSKALYDKLCTPKKMSLEELIRKSPLKGLDMEFGRNRKSH